MSEEDRPKPTLVAYASRHGASREIAGRVAAKLTDAGEQAELRSVKQAGDPAGYEAVVVGGATCMGSWLRQARQLVRANRAVLSTKPVWLFSSGPLGSATADSQGRDALAAAVPKQSAEPGAAVGARDERVFFGALDRARLRGAHRMIGRLPAGQRLLIEGDFHDWDAVDAWAEGIAEELAAPCRALV